jgi:putative endonuclease
MYYVYIIESISTGKWYFGFTNELDQRLEAHNKGLNKSTNNRGPWKYIFQRSFESKSGALSFELYLKKTRNKIYIRSRFKAFFI